MNKIPTLSTTTHYFVDILPKNGDQSHEIELYLIQELVEEKEDKECQITELESLLVTGLRRKILKRC